MALMLDGVPVRYDINIFQALVKKAGGWTHVWRKSAMTPVRNLTRDNAFGTAVIQALKMIPK